MVDSIFVERLLEKYKRLKISKITGNSVVVEGGIRLNHSFNLVPFSEEFQVEIEIPRSYPRILPTIREIGDKIDRNYNHINYDGSLCLEVERVIRNKLSPSYDIVEWIEEFVFSFLYSYCYYISYGVYPFGDRSHGAKGIVEHYMELFELMSIEDTRSLLEAAREYRIGMEYKGHWLCPCGSLKKVRKCHGIRRLGMLSKYIDEQMKKDLRSIEWEESYIDN